MAIAIVIRVSLGAIKVDSSTVEGTGLATVGSTTSSSTTLTGSGSGGGGGEVIIQSG